MHLLLLLLLLHRTVAGRPYESVIEVLLRELRRRGRGDRGRGRWRRGGDESLMLARRVYLDVLVALGLHLRGRGRVTRRGTRARPRRSRSLAMPLLARRAADADATAVVIHRAEAHVFVLRAARLRLDRGIVVRASAAEPSANPLAYYYGRGGGGRHDRGDLGDAITIWGYDSASDERGRRKV